MQRTSTRFALALSALLMPLTLAECGGSDGGTSKPGGVPPGVASLESALAIYDGLPAPSTNVLLISLDSTRRDFLSCYGYVPQFAPNEKTTPHLDRLAAEGVKLEEAYSTTSWTLPSHMSLMTGQPELVHGVDLDPFRLNAAMPTLAAILHRVGYYTAGYFSGPYLHGRYGFDRGFDAYSPAYGNDLAEANAERSRLQRELDEVQRNGDAARQRELLRQISAKDKKLDGLSHRDRSSQNVTDAAIAAVDRGITAGRPWFVFAHYFDPHFDYDPPLELAKRFDPDYSGDIDGLNYFLGERVGKRKKDDPDFGPREQVCSARDLDHVKALYAAEIAWTDSQLGRLVEHVRSKRQLDNTLVVLIADHGDEFFEHGGLGHRHTLYEELVRIPMILRMPKSLPPGRAVSGLASLPDVLPTILEILDLPLPEGLVSHSFLPLVDGREDGSQRYVLGRLIQFHPWTRLRPDMPIARVTVQDSFRKGGLKLQRWRRWEEALPEAPPALKAEVNAKIPAMRERDRVLVWTDFARGSREMEKDFQSDWSDPAAAAALEEWRKIYAQVLRAGGPSELAEGTGADAAQLTALGYVQARAESRAAFEFPPPGEGR